MGFVADTLGGLFGSGADAAEDAAQAQANATDRAIAAQQEADKQAREDLTPFRDAGSTDLEKLARLVTDPQAQAEFIRNNPFFETLADESEGRILRNQAARGKVGSGETAKDLQTSLLRLGSDLLNRDVSQRFNLATLGSNAAARQATNTLNTAANIGNLETQKGNALASGIIGARNAQTDALNTVLNVGTLAL